jgi:hypothetical protein
MISVLLFFQKIQFNDTHHFIISSFNLCSRRATDRGPGQHVIAVSVFGPKENKLFQQNLSLIFLRNLVREAVEIYPGWIFRVYHDSTIDELYMRQIESHYNHVDFCNMTNSSFLPPRMWRFLPAGDQLVDVSK